MVLHHVDFQERETRQQLRLCIDVRRKAGTDQQDAIDVIGLVDVGHEAAVDYKLLCARPLRGIVQSSDRLHLYSPQLRRAAELGGNFLEAGGMKSRRQQAIVVELWNHRSIASKACRIPVYILRGVASVSQGGSFAIDDLLVE